MSHKAIFYQYLANVSPEDSMQVMKNFGYTVRARSTGDIAQALRAFANKEGEDGLNALAKIHPDRELILGSVRGLNFTGDTDPGYQATSLVDKPTALAQQPTADSHINHISQIVIAGLFGLALVSVVIIAKS